MFSFLECIYIFTCNNLTACFSQSSLASWAQAWGILRPAAWWLERDLRTVCFYWLFLSGLFFSFLGLFLLVQHKLKALNYYQLIMNSPFCKSWASDLKRTEFDLSAVESLWDHRYSTENMFFLMGICKIKEKNT